MTDTPDNKAPAPETPAPKAEKKARAPKAKKATDTAAPAAAEASAAPAPKAEAKKSEKSEVKTEAKADAKSADATAPTADAPKKIETAKDLLSDDIGELKIRRAKGSKNITSGICHILATFNNTLITFTDKAGNTIARSSSGKCGFKGAKKSTAYAAQVVCQDAAKAAMAHGLKEVEIRLSGPGMGRDSAVRAIQTLGLGVSSLIDVTPIPHNGCRARKRRRV